MILPAPTVSLGSGPDKLVALNRDHGDSCRHTAPWDRGRLSPSAIGHSCRTTDRPRPGNSGRVSRRTSYGRTSGVSRSRTGGHGNPYGLRTHPDPTVPSHRFMRHPLMTPPRPHRGIRGQRRPAGKPVPDCTRPGFRDGSPPARGSRTKSGSGRRSLPKTDQNAQNGGHACGRGKGGKDYAGLAIGHLRPYPVKHESIYAPAHCSIRVFGFNTGVQVLILIA